MNCAVYTASLPSGVRIAFAEEPAVGNEKAVIVLLHGFPQTSYQFRKVIKPLASKGYRVLAPDYRGAGLSSKPHSSFTKSELATDIVHLLDHLGITNPIHMIGHDIGGMIAYTFAARYSDRTASVVWGECPLPGTTIHEEDRTTHAVQQFHFLFHCVPDLAEALVTGKERVYLAHFFDKLAYHRSAITEDDLNYYVGMYQREGALRCAFRTYEAFLQDADECRDWVSKHGKSRVQALGLSGSHSRHANETHRMMAEVHEKDSFTVAEVPGSGHYIAEENPQGFVGTVLKFIE